MKLGLDAKLYRGTAGNTGSSEVKNITNESLNLSKDESDATTRGSGGWKSIVGTLKEGTLEFTLLDDGATGSSDNISAFWDAFLNDTPLAIKTVDNADGRGIDADWSIMNMTTDKELTNIVGYKVTAKVYTVMRTPTPVDES